MKRWLLISMVFLLLPSVFADYLITDLSSKVPLSEYGGDTDDLILGGYFNGMLYQDENLWILGRDETYGAFFRYHIPTQTLHNLSNLVRSSHCLPESRSAAPVDMSIHDNNIWISACTPTPVVLGYSIDSNSIIFDRRIGQLDDSSGITVSPVDNNVYLVGQKSSYYKMWTYDINTDTNSILPASVFGDDITYSYNGFAKYYDGNIWAGRFPTNWISRYNIASNSTHHFLNAGNEFHQKAVVVDKNIWVATHNRLTAWNIDKNAPEDYSFLISDIFDDYLNGYISIVYDNNDNLFVMGTSTGLNGVSKGHKFVKIHLPTMQVTNLTYLLDNFDFLSYGSSSGWSSTDPIPSELTLDPKNEDLYVIGTMRTFFSIDINHPNTPPDLNLNEPDGNQYIKSDYNINFNVKDIDDDELHLSIYYSTTKGTVENIIESDLNLDDYANISNLTCASADWTSSRDCNYTWSVLNIPDGNYFIDLNLWDESYRYSNKSSQDSFYVDTNKPTTSWDRNENWTKGSQTVTLTCHDSGSGCSTTKYRINGGSWQSYSAPFTISGEGDWAIDFNSTDIAGNVGDTNSKHLRIDNTAPVYVGEFPSTDVSNGDDSTPSLYVLFDDNSLSGVSTCHVRVFKNESTSLWRDVFIDGNGTACVYTVPGADTLSVDDKVFLEVLEVGDGADNNVVVDYNTAWYRYYTGSGGTSSPSGGGVSVTVLPGGLGGVGSFCQNDLDCSAGLYCDGNAGVCVRDSPIAETIVDYSWSDSVKLVSSDSNSEFSVVLVNKTSKDLPLVASVDSNLSRYLSLVSDVNSLPAFGVRRIAWRVFVDGNFSGARGNVVVVVGSGRAVLSHVLELKPSVGLGALWGYRLFEFSQPLPFVGRVLTLGFGVFVVVVLVVLWWVYKRG